jgi:hypothetical protein
MEMTAKLTMEQMQCLRINAFKKLIPEIAKHQGNTPNSVFSSPAVWTNLSSCLNKKTK